MTDDPPPHPRPMLRGMAIGMPLGAALLAVGLWACQGSDGAPPQTSGGRPTATAKAAPAPAPPAPDLIRYEGRYPFDAVEGVTFPVHPLVRAAVEQSVRDPALRQRILSSDVTAAPVERIGERLLYWACEPHNCGAHNWTVMLLRDGRGAEVCYVNVDDPARSGWYRGGQRQALSREGCPQNFGSLTEG